MARCSTPVSRCPAAYVATVRQLGGPPVDARRRWSRRYWLGTPEVILADLLGRDVDGGRGGCLLPRAGRGATSRRTPAWPTVLAALRTRGHPVAVFTGASSRAAAILLTSAGVAVDLVVGGDQVRRPKPAGDGLLLAASRLGVPPASLAYIGDAPNDLRAARSAAA